jgi:hypothetical protein
LSDTRDPKPPIPAGGPVRPRLQGGILRVPWEPGMRAGSGYDSVTRVIHSSAPPDGLKLTSRPQDENPGQKVVRKVEQIEGTERMRQVLQVSSSLDVGYDLFSANTLAQYMRETSFTKFSLYFMVTCYVENGQEDVENFRVDPKLNRASDSDFRQGYGDYFVSGWVKGGYLIAIARISAESQQLLDKARAEMGGSYSDGLTRAKGGFASNWERCQQISGLTFSLEAMWAGMGEGVVKTIAQSGGLPDAPPMGVPVPVRPRDNLPPLEADDRLPVDDDEDDDEDGDEDDLVGGEPSAGGAGNGAGGAPRPSPPARAPAGGAAGPSMPKMPDHLSPGLNPDEPIQREPVRMQMQSLLDDRAAKSGARRCEPRRAALSSLLFCGARAPRAWSSRLPVPNRVVVGNLPP